MKLKSTRKKGRRGLKFCMRPYLTKLTTTKHNLTLLCSGGWASIFPLGLTLPQIQKRIKGQHQEQNQVHHQKYLIPMGCDLIVISLVFAVVLDAVLEAVLNVVSDVVLDLFLKL